MKKKKQKKKSISSLRKRAERVFNLWIRLRNADDNGYVRCVTCGKVDHYTQMNAGHFEHGLDWVEDNMHAQCVRCNKWLHGNEARYALFMIDTYGRERTEELMNWKKKSLSGQKLSKSDYEEIIEKYQIKKEG